MIMTDQNHQIPSELQTGSAVGMQAMDQALLDAIHNKLVDSDDAVRFAHDKSKFQRFVTDTTILTKADLAT